MFLDGQAAVFIATEVGRDLRLIEDAIAYMAHKLGAPSVSVERFRIIEHHHRNMLRINAQIASTTKFIERLDHAVDALTVGDILALPEEDLMKLTKLMKVRGDELFTLTKLQTEIRNVTTAINNLFGLGDRPVPDESVDDADSKQLKKRRLDNLTEEQLVKLLEGELEKVSVAPQRRIKGKVIDAEFEDSEG